MKKILTFIAVLFLLPNIVVAQRHKKYRSQNPWQPTFVYYNYYNDVQMIEISYFASWQQKRSTPEAMQPTAIPWEAKNPLPPSSYVFRNKNGVILKKYLAHNENFIAHSFANPGTEKTIAHKHKNHTEETEDYFYYKQLLRLNTADNGTYFINCSADANYRYKVFSSSGKTGLIDTLGNLVADTIYTQLTCADSIYYFSLKYKTGIMTKDFVVTFPDEHDYIQYFDKGLYCVTDYHNYGFIDKKGKPVTPIKYYGTPGKFVDGLLLVLEVKTNHGNKWGFIDSTGKEVIELKYSSLQPFRNGLAIAQLDNKFGFIDKKGKIIINFKYEYVSRFENGYSVVKRNGMYGMINIKGDEVIPCEYSYLSEFSEGLAIARKHGDRNVGYINEKNETIIPFIYDNAWPFEKGKAKVQVTGEKEIYINKKGKQVPANNK